MTNETIKNLDGHFEIVIDWWTVENAGCTLSEDEFSAQIAKEINEKFGVTADVECDPDFDCNDIRFIDNTERTYDEALAFMGTEVEMRDMINRMIDRLAAK